MNRSSTIGTWIALAALSIALAQAQVATPTPQPSTNPAEGTAADRTPPGKTPTRDTARNTTVDPRPSTSETEGTAADRTSPDDSSRSGASAGGARASTLVGAQVVTPADAPIGKVVDVVFDTRDQPAFLVIESGSTQVAVPYAAASSMMSGTRVVIDQSRLERAPKVKQGEWRNRSNESWKADAAKYWMKDQRQDPKG